jgi:hypothetical protein
MSLYDQALAESQNSTQQKGVFRQVVVDTGLADSMLWFVLGILAHKFLF